MKKLKGIDGYIGDSPVSIKPQTYEPRQMLPESIGVQIIYYGGCIEKSIVI
ncbi:MAG: MjaI family restriction endonuclease [Pseudomonadota bacterium]|nr:MjaI family restriction endonuclease [Pseudomonadota bacterium]